MRKLLDIDTVKGFTMMELLVSITLIALIASLSLPAFVFSMKVSNQNKMRLTADSLAANVIEELNGTPYEDIKINSDAPDVKTIEIDGIEYNIETLVTWEERNDDPEAFKNIKVTVKAKDPFTGDNKIFSEMFTCIFSDVKEQVVEEERPSGNLMLTLKKARNDSVLDMIVDIRIEGPLESNNKLTMGTGIRNYDSISIFPELPIGTYNITAYIPEGYYSPECLLNQEGSGNVVKKQVYLENGGEKLVTIYLDKPENLVDLHLVFEDYSSGIINTRLVSGLLSLIWDIDGERRILISNKDITELELNNGSYIFYMIENLWPLDNYNVIVKDIYGYRDVFIPEVYYKPDSYSIFEVRWPLDK